MKQQFAAVSVGMVVGCQILLSPFLIAWVMGTPHYANDFGWDKGEVLMAISICAIVQWVLCLIILGICGEGSSDDMSAVRKHKQRQAIRDANLCDMKLAMEHLYKLQQGEIEPSKDRRR